MERIPKTGKTSTFRTDERFVLCGWQVVLKGASEGKARLLFIAPDGAEPYIGGSNCRRIVCAECDLTKAQKPADS